MRKFFLIICLVLFAQSSFADGFNPYIAGVPATGAEPSADVTYDSVAQGVDTDGSSASWEHTCTDCDLIMVYIGAYQGGDIPDVTAVTAEGNACTEVAYADSAGGEIYGGMWVCTTGVVGSGATTIAVTFDAACTHIRHVSVGYTDGATASNGSCTAGYSASPVSTDVATTGTDEMAVGMCYKQDVAPTPGDTARGAAGVTSFFIAGAELDGTGGTDNLDFSWAGDSDWTIRCAARVNP